MHKGLAGINSMIIKRMRGYALEVIHWISLSYKLRNIEQQYPILVYQMGKVGSSTVVETLNQLDLQVPILHVHTLSKSHLKHAITRKRSSISPYLPKHLIVSSILVKKMRQEIFPCRIVTVTREPVGRAVSFVFEDLRKQAPDAILGNKRLNIHKIESALTKLLEGDNGIANPTKWFNEELKTCIGVDVFSQAYDLVQGYNIFRSAGIEALVIRMEDLNRALLPALISFLGMDLSHISLEQANVGAKKWYAKELGRIKETYRVPEGPARSVFDTQYFEHFYAGEKNRYLARWT